MNFYSLNSSFNFGKHKGKDLLSVIKTDLEYINWCLINIDIFIISDQTLSELINLIPELKFSDLAENFRKMKIKYNNQIDDEKSNLIWVDLILKRIFSNSY
jgi:site-specific DNA-adenine methylase